MSKSYSLARTNTNLTSNIKIVYDENDKLYCESFDSNTTLADTRYKHFIFNKNNKYEDIIPLFYKDIPKNIAFDVKFDNDENILYNDYKNQFDDIYLKGAKYVEDNYYKEKFEYFSPLYLDKKNPPSAFVIFRVDDSFIYDENDNITSTSRLNFRSEILEKFKCVKYVNLKNDNAISGFLKNSFIENDRYTNNTFYFNPEKYEFSKYFGFDYNTGIFTEKDEMLYDFLYYEKPYYEFERYISEGYERNSIIYPNIINFKFLFNDNRCNPFEKLYYTNNRYFGFYIDESVNVLNVSQYNTPLLKSDITITDNIFYTNGGDSSICPFIDETIVDTYIYVYNNEIKGALYNVVRVDDGSSFYYKILSDKQINIADIKHNKNINVEFNYSGKTYHNYLNNVNDIDIYVDGSGFKKELKADVYLIKILNEYHILKYDDVLNKYYIQSDYGIRVDENNVSIYKGDLENPIITNVYNTPEMYSIYKMVFCDVKDIDCNYLDTDFADYDYKKYGENNLTDEKCLNVKNYNSDYVIKEYAVKSNDEILNVSSEYVADDELYSLENGYLIDMIRKNHSSCKFTFKDSISNCDSDYKLNICKDFPYNRTLNPFGSISPSNKSMDYFYRIGDYVSRKDENYTPNIYNNIKYLSTDGADSYPPTVNCNKLRSIKYQTQTTNISEVFNLDLYLSGEFDYFDYYFNNLQQYNISTEQIGLKQFKKYSVFNCVGNSMPCETLFKGLKIKLNNVNNMILDVDGNVSNITYNNMDYSGYKFSILLNLSGMNLYDFTTANNFYRNISSFADNEKLYITDSNNVLSNNSVNIFLNEKHKNILIILNASFNDVINKYNIFNLDVVSAFKNKTENNYIKENSIYDSSNDNNLSNRLNLYYFTETINNLVAYGENGSTPTYYYINVNNDLYKHHILDVDNTFSELEGWNKNFTNYLLSVEFPTKLEMKVDSYNVDAIKIDEISLNEYVSRKINKNYRESYDLVQYYGEINNNQINTIYRYKGYYDILLKNITLFNTIDYNSKILFTSESNGLYTNSSYYKDGMNGTVYVNNVSNILNEDYKLLDVTIADGLGTTVDFTLTLSGFNFNIPNNVNVVSGITNIEIFIVGGGSNNGTGAKAITTNIKNIKLTTDSKYDDYNLTYGMNYKISDHSIIITGVNFNVFDINSLKVDVSFYMNNTNVFTNRNDKKVLLGIDYMKVILHYENEYVGNMYVLDKNIIFADNLNNFGEIGEITYSKVNPTENFLILKNSNINRSIYPIIDEIGYTIANKRFIFNSVFDSVYYIKTLPIFKSQAFTNII